MRFRLASASIALVFVATSAHAERRKVALVNGNAVLEQQVKIALSAWDVDVEHVDWTSLPSGMPGAAKEARLVAEKYKVDAVVWISETGTAHALWIYDVSEGHAVTRPLPIPPPTDAADAASVALNLKTLMRSTTAAPESERIGAGEVSPIGPAGVFRAEADGGARMLATNPSTFELRVAITGLWFPGFLNEYAALGLGFSAGPGVPVHGDAFTGRFLDLSLTPSLRVRLPLGRFALEPAIGTAIHLTNLDGAATQQNLPVRSTRVDPSLDGSLLFSFALTGGVSVGLRGGGSYLLRYQTYKILGQPILEVSPLQVSAAIVLGARLN